MKNQLINTRYGIALIISIIISSYSTIQAADYYLTGINNQWDANDSNKLWAFTKIADGTYVIENMTLPVGNFKVAAKNWSEEYGLGTYAKGTTPLDINKEISLVNPGGNMLVTSDMKCTKITFTKNGDQATIKVEGNPIVLSGFYLLGDAENNIYNPNYEFIDNRNNNYTLANQPIGAGMVIMKKPYQLVWSQEFNDSRDSNGKGRLPSTNDWIFETGGSGWGNNELQYYVDRFAGNDTVAKILDGNLVITAFKHDFDNRKYISARMTTKQTWEYGYFEMRAKLPKGRGTWPAFWMLPPVMNDVSDGEIDIMEHVGYDPGVIHFSAHSGTYNPTNGNTQTGNITIPDYDTAFHTYGLEWSPNYVKGYVDDKCYFTFSNDFKGDHNSWPFNTPFNLKLNLAIGGDWGGYMGVDDKIFPVSYIIDYIRIYQRIAQN